MPPLSPRVRLLLRVVVTVALVALVVWVARPFEVLGALGGLRWGWFAVGAVAAVSATGFSTLRWYALCRWLGIATTRRALLLAVYLGIATNTVVPGGQLGGDAARVVTLQRAGAPLATAVVSIVLDRVSGLWMLAVATVAGATVAAALGLAPGELPPAWASLGLTVAGLAAPLVAWRLASARPAWLPSRLASALGLLTDRPAPLAQYLRQAGWSGAVHGASVITFASGARAVGVDLSFPELVAAAGPIFVVASVPVGVGGWGTREAAAVVILGWFGVARELAVATGLLYGTYATLLGLAGAFTLLARPVSPASPADPP